MKILLTGCRGQLGLELQRQLAGQPGKFQVVGTDLPELDIADGAQTNDICNREKPDVIINAAAYTDVDSCETNEAIAMAVNGRGAGNLAAAAREIGAKIVQVSTDYVYDGSGSAPYVESDPVCPINVYGESKALGEALVRESNARHYIVRTAWLYGEGRNFVRTMLDLAGQRDELNVVDDQFGSPTSTVDLAKCIINLIGTEHYGTYHGTCEGVCSWYQFAQKILAGKNIRINPISTEALNRPAPRPRFSVLENARLKSLGMNNFRSWEEALFEYLEDENH